MLKLKFLLTFCVCLFLFQAVSEAATFTVTGSNPNDLIAAIQAANASTDPDNTVVLPNGVTFTFTNGTFTYTTTDGVFGNNALPPIGKGVGGVVRKLRIQGNGSRLFRPANAPNFRFIVMDNYNELHVDNLTFEGADAVSQGAAIQSGYKSLIVVNGCKFINNQTTTTTERGGGAIATRSRCRVEANNCEFINNRSRTRGGAVSLVLSDLVMTNCKIIGNKIVNRVGENQGGGVYVDGARGNTGEIIVEDCVFEDNESFNAGGGLYVFPYNENEVTVNRCTFRNNKSLDVASGVGGGFYIGSSILNNNDTDMTYPAYPFGPTTTVDETTLTLSNSTFIDNLARQGGGGTLIDGGITQNIFNCTFTQNRAAKTDGNNGYGAGMWILSTNNPPASPKTVNIYNCTFADNYSGTAGGAIYGGGANVFVNNTIFANNIANNNGSGSTNRKNCTRTFSGNNNIEFPGMSSANDILCATGITVIDPKLLPLGDYGGSTLTMALDPTSPAIDPIGTATASTSDQRGIAAFGIKRDIGAFEFDGSNPATITPANLLATTISNIQINLTWQDKGGNGFELERSKGNIFNFTQIASLGDNVVTYQDTGLDPNTTYYYRARAIGATISEYSNRTGAITQTSGACNDATYQAKVIPNPIVIVGDGTPASCTQTTIQSALDAGDNNTIMCNCGLNPIAISITSQLNVQKNNLTFDGGGLVSLDGGNNTRIFNIREGNDFTLQNIKLINGKAPATGGLFNESGGAILVGSGVTGKGNGEIKIINVDFTNNSITNINAAERGGGAIYTYSLRNLLISHCNFIGNSANVGGAIGGIGSQVTLINSNFTNNQAVGAEAFLSGVGGAVYLDGIDLYDINDGDTGGTASVIDSDHIFTVCGSTFTNNEGKHEGGAIYCVFSDGNRNKMLVNKSSFENNRLISANNGNGGAIFLIEDDFAGTSDDGNLKLEIKNSTFADNTVKRQGGALWVILSGTAQISNSTFEGNSVTTPSGSLGGAIALSSANYGGTYTFSNCTIANNASAHFGAGIFGASPNVVNLNNNIFSQNASDFEWEGHQVAGNATFGAGTKNILFPKKRWNGSDDSFPADTLSTKNPYLQALAFNGGFTKTMVIPDTSIAVNATTSNALATDQRELASVGVRDVGAYEAGAVITGAPIITNFTPQSGNLGTTVTITGFGFVIGNTTVAFNGINAIANVIDVNTIEAIVPNLATTGKISAATTLGTGFSLNDFIVIIPIPTITNISPTTATSGQTVTITGTDFLSTTAITIGGINVTNFTVVDNTSITFTIPNDAVSGLIQITTNGGQVSSATNFLVIPRIIDFNPKFGMVGTEITITGTNFIGLSALSINGTAMTTLNLVNSTTATAQVGIGTTTGIISLTATDGPANTSTLPIPNFTIVGPPSITDFEPKEGIAGTQVKIYGTNLLYITSVTFNGINAPNFSSIAGTADTLYVTVPNNATTGLINIITPGGTVSTASNFKVLPSIADFTPKSGIAGDIITITGTNLLGATIKIGTVDMTNIIINPDGTSLTAQVGTGTITEFINLIATDGTATSDTTFRIIQTPTITSFTPANGKFGDEIEIIGTNFTDVNELRLNGQLVAEFAIVDDTKILLEINNLVSSGTFSIKNAAGTATSATQLTILPTIFRFSPKEGPVGTNVVISGANLSNTSIVQFNGSNAVSITQISTLNVGATVPVGATTGTISLTTTNGGTATSVDIFTLTTNPAPTITNLSPATGAIGALITITGTNFIAGQTQVRFFNGVNVPIVNFISTTQVAVNVPLGATDGNVTVITPNGTSNGVFFNVTLPPPAITAFAPLSGYVGSTITLTGSNFNGVTQVQFTNGATVDAATFTILSPSSISVVIPNGTAIGLNNITITSPNGSTDIDALTPNRFDVQIPPPPATITGVSPNTGLIGQTIQVVITGENLIGVTLVSFNDVLANSFVINNSTKITATITVTGAMTGQVKVASPNTFVDVTPDNFTAVNVITWDGSTSSNWNELTNWTPEIIPNSATVDVIIPNTTNKPQTNATVFTVRNITIAIGAKLTVAPAGGGLTVFGLLANAGTLEINQDAILDIRNTLTNTGIVTSSLGGTLRMGGTVQQTIPASISNLTRLVIDNPANVLMGGDLNVSDFVNFMNGDLLLNGRVLNLGTTGTINNETEANHIKGNTGSVLASRTGTNFLGTGLNVANLGAKITTAAAVTGITIRRGHTQRTDGTDKGIFRYYVITPSGATTNLDATLDFSYFQEELDGIPESSLVLFRWSGTEWENKNYFSRNTTDNFITLNNIPQFSEWTAGNSSAPLPVQLLTFKGQRQAIDKVQLTWQTASEINNLGFEVEMSIDGLNFQTLGFIDGAGNSNTLKSYQFTANQNSDAHYRLQIIDLQQKKKASAVIFVKGEMPTLTWFPNPAQENLQILLSAQNHADKLFLEVFNAQGTRIFGHTGNKSQIEEKLNQKFKYWSDGLYIFQVVHQNSTYRTRLVKNR